MDVETRSELSREAEVKLMRVEAVRHMFVTLGALSECWVIIIDECSAMDQEPMPDGFTTMMPRLFNSFDDAKRHVRHRAVGWDDGFYYDEVSNRAWTELFVGQDDKDFEYFCYQARRVSELSDRELAARFLTALTDDTGQI